MVVVGGVNMGTIALYMPLGRMLPFPTMVRDVSGRKRAMDSRQHGELMERNQKIALQSHRSNRRPLMTGPILGGVLRLLRNREESVIKFSQ